MTDKEIIARQAAKIIELEDKIKKLEENSIPIQKIFMGGLINNETYRFFNK